MSRLWTQGAHTEGQLQTLLTKETIDLDQNEADLDERMFADEHEEVVLQVCDQSFVDVHYLCQDAVHNGLHVHITFIIWKATQSLQRSVHINSKRCRDGILDAHQYTEEAFGLPPLGCLFPGALGVLAGGPHFEVGRKAANVL